MSRLDGTVALVIGGARGIGAAIARAMAGHGPEAVIGDLLERTMSFWPRGLGASAKCVHPGVTRPDDWETVAMNRVGGPIETLTPCS
jgi:NAD(P)-dependent dehydrogenase (short-subunit alcohol dehydrogenase family)